MLAHFPSLSRYDLGLARSPGPGLGNLLFPISRALIGQARYGGEFIYPTMRQVKIGPFLRGESDKRTYGHVFYGRTLNDWRLWVKVHSLPKVQEQEFDGSQQEVAVRYEGLGRFFHDLVSHRELIATWITQQIRHQSSENPYDIGIHVRLGDFSKKSAIGSGQSIQLPIEWYQSAHAEAARLLGNKLVRTILFTDEDPLRVRDLLGLDGIEIDNSVDAVNAIRHLAKARCIVASRSTFSMWATFLSDSIAIWDKNFDLASAFPIRQARDRFV